MPTDIMTCLSILCQHVYHLSETSSFNGQNVCNRKSQPELLSTHKDIAFCVAHDENFLQYLSIMELPQHRDNVSM